MKANFTISLTVPKEYNAISNMHEESSTDTGKGRTYPLNHG